MDSNDMMWIICFFINYFLHQVEMSLPKAAPRLTLKPSVVGEYCSKEKFNATCASDEVVLMIRAKFGRMHFGRCMKEDHGHVGCSSNVLAHIDKKCSGKDSCSYDIQDDTLQKMTPCPKELMSFLEAEYNCIPVAAANLNQVCRKSQQVMLPPPPGYISSSIADHTRFGQPDCPWTLTVDTGRRIRLSIYNFVFSTMDSTRRGSCEVYMSVVDQRRVTNITMCRGDVRHKEVYVSDKNSLQLSIPPPPKAATETRRFIIYYEAVGCADLKAPPNAMSKRVGNTAFVRCNYTAATFFLTCEGTDWIGQIGNCSKASHSKGSEPRSSRFPYGILVVIGIGVALGVAVGIVLLMGILICFKRRKEKQLRSLTTDPLLEDNPHEHDDNAAQCNCGAKIYYATRAEMQRQLALSPMTVRGPTVEVTSNLPEIPDPQCHTIPSDGHALPMPDMCIVESTSDKPVSNPSESIADENSSPRQMQTSFITFKPAQNAGAVDGANIYNNPAGNSRICMSSGSPARTQSCNSPKRIGEILSSDSPKVTSKLITDSRSRDPRTRYKTVKTLDDTYGSRIPAANIYEKRLSQLPCAECAKETISANKTNAAQEQSTGNKSV